MRYGPSSAWKRLDDAQPSVADLLDGFETMQLFLRQGDQRHDGSPNKPGRTPGSVKSPAFLSSFMLTSLGSGKCRISNWGNCRITK